MNDCAGDLKSLGHYPAMKCALNINHLGPILLNIVSTVSNPIFGDAFERFHLFCTQFEIICIMSLCKAAYVYIGGYVKRSDAHDSLSYVKNDIVFRTDMTV